LEKGGDYLSATKNRLKKRERGTPKTKKKRKKEQAHPRKKGGPYPSSKRKKVNV